MDVRSLSSAPGSRAVVLAQNTLTIAGDCGEPPTAELSDAVQLGAAPPLLPRRGRQCLVVIDDSFLEARRAGIEVALDHLYLRVQQFDLQAVSGVVSGNGAAIWLSNMTLQGGPSYGAAINPFNHSYVHVSDSTISGWADTVGAIATVDRASSLMFHRCAITGNGADGGSLVATQDIADFTPSTVVVHECTLEDNLGVFYAMRSTNLGLLYADEPLSVAALRGGSVMLSDALPLASFDPAASAPVLQADDNPLLRDPVAEQAAADQTSPSAAPPPPPLPPQSDRRAPIAGGGGDEDSAAYRVFVVVCIAGMVLIGCMLCALAACVVSRYRSAQRKEWRRFHDDGQTATLEMGTRVEGDTGALAASYSVPADAALAGAAYAAQATGGQPPSHSAAASAAMPAPAAADATYFVPASQPLPHPAAASAAVRAPAAADATYFAPASEPPPAAQSAPVGPSPAARASWAPPESTYAATETDALSQPATERFLLR